MSHQVIIMSTSDASLVVVTVGEPGLGDKHTGPVFILHV